jgi:hypothetical protein
MDEWCMSEGVALCASGFGDGNILAVILVPVVALLVFGPIAIVGVVFDEYVKPRVQLYLEERRHLKAKQKRRTLFEHNLKLWNAEVKRRARISNP